MINSIQ